jgi:outer membrane immunogenic protein
MPSNKKYQHIILVILLGLSARARAIEANEATGASPPVEPSLSTETSAFSERTPPTINWNGFYGGLNAGYAFAVNGKANVNPNTIQICTPGQGCTANPTFADASVSSASVSVNPNNRGTNGGAQLGYLQNLDDRWVGGIEADIRGFTDKTATGSIRRAGVAMGMAGVTLTSNTSVSNSMDCLGTLRGRIGYLVNPSLLLSISGGAAIAEVRSATSINQFLTGPSTPGVATSWSSSGKYSGTRFGWTLGGGVEWMYRTNWSLKAEYFYYSLGSASYNSSNLAPPISTAGFPATYFANSVNTTSYFRNQLIQVGVNYHFC